MSVNLSEQLLQGTPGGRDIWSLVEYKVPSLLITRPDVGGTSGGLQGTYSARGTTLDAELAVPERHQRGRPGRPIGAAGFYYDFDAFEDIQVSTGAHDITVPTSGVFMNMVTKGGTDQWRGRTTFTWLGDATQWQNMDDNLLRLRFPSGNQRRGLRLRHQRQRRRSGDRARNCASSVRSATGASTSTSPPRSPTLVLDKTDITSGMLNATYQMSDKNRLTGFYSRQYYKKPNRFLTTSNLLEQASTSNEDDVFDVYQVLWNSVVTQQLLRGCAPGAEQDLLPHLPQRQRPDTARHGHQHPDPQLHLRHRTLARSLPGQCHRRSTTWTSRSAAATN